jgi:hypothetical protein
LDGAKGDKHAVVTPQVPTRGSVGQAIFNHDSHRQVNDAMGVMATGWSKISKIDIETLLTP